MAMENFELLSGLLKQSWDVLTPNIRNVINDAGFETFFQALWDQDTTEYRDLHLLVALSEWFWDTTYTFHFLGIGEVMLTPYDFLGITGLKLVGEGIKGHDTISAKTYLGVNPPRVNGRNVSLMWLFSNFEKFKSVETGTWMFMLLFIRTLLCPNLGSTVWMYEYFGVGPQLLEDVADELPRFLRCMPKNHLSTLPKHSLQAWRMVIDGLDADDALELNERQVLFEYGHGRY
ncbi:hypothetical protein SO802_017673 [Lithocarpus litseifolius]|uniref:Aminotransferase-like plant mobile domain-containing protein n=1 Tax=Lithocarpus litseifolius TaxID=425828 RepID=A0AAW2CNJ7_9ROSI